MSRQFTLQLISITSHWIDVLVIQWLRDLFCKFDMVDEVAFYARINGKSNIGNSSYSRKKALKSIQSITFWERGRKSARILYSNIAILKSNNK